MQIYDLLHHACLKESDTVAVIQGDRQLTYGQFLNHVSQTADCLAQNGCGAGVKVGLFLRNSIEYLIAFFAVSKTHSTIVPLSPDMTLFELQSKISSVDISMIVSDQNGCVDMVNSKLQIAMTSLNLSKNNDLEIQTIKSAAPIVDPDNSDVALIISTSGSTDHPKHVMLTDNQLISNMSAYKKVMSFHQKHMVYCALPFCHIYSISAQILTHVSLADTLFIPKGPFLIKTFFDAVDDFRITISAFVPYFAILMSKIPQPNNINLDSLKYILLAGGKTPIDTLTELSKTYPSVNFINTYGLTEASPRISVAGPKPLDFSLGGVGKPMPNIFVKIIGDAGSELPVDKIGQIVVNSPGNMKGYYKQPTLTKEALSNGWLKTGDLGTLDNNGNLIIIARIKDVIISGGRNIYPNEVEQSLLKHPLIIEAVVVGKPHSQLMEVPFAFIVSRNNVKMEVGGLMRHCRKYLSNYKVPHEFRIIKEIPKISASKVNRKKLIMELAGGKVV